MLLYNHMNKIEWERVKSVVRGREEWTMNMVGPEAADEFRLPKLLWIYLRL